jgi:hypothetical protein
MNKKAPRDIDDVSWAIGKSFFSYLFLFTNQTKLFKRQEGDNELNDRKTSTAQPTAMTIEARQTQIGMFFSFFLTY